MLFFGGRPALRPFAAAPRPVASARRPAPRAPLRFRVFSVFGVVSVCVVSIVGGCPYVGSSSALGCPVAPLLGSLRSLRFKWGLVGLPFAPVVVLGRSAFIVVPPVRLGVPPACPSWARYARSALNGHAGGSPSLPCWRQPAPRLYYTSVFVIST